MIKLVKHFLTLFLKLTIYVYSWESVGLDFLTYICWIVSHLKIILLNVM